MKSSVEVVERLLVVHEDPLARGRVVSTLAGFGFDTVEAGSFARALDPARASRELAAALLSVPVIQQSGLGVGEALRSIRSAAGTDSVIVLFDAPPDVEFSREAVDARVCGFVDARPDGVDEASLRRHALAAVRQLARRRRERATVCDPALGEHEGFIARSPMMTDVLGRAARAAQISDVPVIIYGESGTGKQMLAELIHRLDRKRCGRRFLSVNCASISGTLAESELFGHAKGAFTGATENRLGHFRAADGGTLLLDEIGELDASLQPKLLRTLQEGMVLPVGADEETPVDVRVIAATHRRLPAMVEEEAFRLDLYQRLNVIMLEIPPLRERPDDIDALVQFFLKKYAGYYHTPVQGVDPAVVRAFTQRRLTGNVRELENTVRQMLAFKTHGDRLELADLEALAPTGGHPALDAAPATSELAELGRRLLDQGQLSLPDLMSQLERDLLSDAVKHSTGTTVELAQRLGLSRRTFYNKLRKYQI